MTPQKKVDITEEVNRIGRAALVVIAVLGSALTAIWKLYAEDAVSEKVNCAIKTHEEQILPQIQRNTDDIIQLKDVNMRTFCLLKQITSEQQKKAAEEEFLEIKRRQ